MVRKGMWCVDTEGCVGIVYGRAADPAQVEFHRVDADGFTTLVINVNEADLVQARIREIPAARKMRNDEQLRALGYQ